MQVRKLPLAASNLPLANRFNETAYVSKVSQAIGETLNSYLVRVHCLGY